MLDILNCSAGFECSGFLVLTITPQIIMAVITTGIFVLILDKLGKNGNLFYKILKISLRVEEVLLLIAAVWIILAII